MLATSIAETSLTLDGVRIVVDSGLARRPRYDRAAGMTRLVTERASQAAVVQRAGRAARQSPGVAYRLWEEAATAGLPRFDPPEILEADLSALLLLGTALWGVSDPRALPWLDPPPEAAVAEARARLTVLEALDETGRPTAHGKAIAKLPMPPRLAHMLIRSASAGWRRPPPKSRCCSASVALAGRMSMSNSASAAGGPSAAQGGGGKGDGETLDRLAPKPVEQEVWDHAAGVCLALAYPDRVARRRDGTGENWASVGGRASGSIPPRGWPVRNGWRWARHKARLGRRASCRLRRSTSPPSRRCSPSGSRRGGPSPSIRQRAASRRCANGGWAGFACRAGLIRGRLPTPSPRRWSRACGTHGLSLLPWSDGAGAYRARAAYAGVALDDETLIERLDDWLPALVAGKRRLDALAPGALTEAIRNLVDWNDQRRIDSMAPSHFTSPAGSSHAIDYAAEGGPARRVARAGAVSVWPSIR